MSTVQWEGVFTHVDENGNEQQMFPEIITDKTLTFSGKAADAAVVGASIRNAESVANNASNIAREAKTLAEEAKEAAENATSNLDFVDHLESEATDMGLTANQGRVLNAKYESLSNELNSIRNLIESLEIAPEAQNGLYGPYTAGVNSNAMALIVFPTPFASIPTVTARMYILEKGIQYDQPISITNITNASFNIHATELMDEAYTMYVEWSAVVA